MTQRQTALTLAKVAGYHCDTQAFTRLIIESRVNRQAMNQAWNIGTILKDNGATCECYDCKRKALACQDCGSIGPFLPQCPQVTDSEVTK